MFIASVLRKAIVPSAKVAAKAAGVKAASVVVVMQMPAQMVSPHGLFADFQPLFGYISCMSTEPLKLQEKLVAEYHARWEAVEIVKAHELAALTEERALEIILSLSAPEGWRADPDWSGLVEQQRLFQRAFLK